MAVVLMMTCMGGIIGTVAYRQLTNERNLQLQTQHQNITTQLDFVIRQSVERATIEIEQLNFLLTSHSEPHINVLPSLWADIQMYWDISSFAMLTPNGEVLVEMGPAIDSQWLEEHANVSKPRWRFYCQEECRLQMLLPTFFADVAGVVFIETSMSDLLNRIRSEQGVELVVLGPVAKQAESMFYWGRQLFSVSNRARIQPIVSEMALRAPWEQLFTNKQLHHIGDQSWVIWDYSLSDGHNGPMLLVMSDVSDWDQALQSFQQSILGILLLGVLLTSLFIFLIAWSPLRRMVCHARLLPLLAERRFDDIRTQIPSVKHEIIDEVDFLGNAILGVTAQLEDVEHTLAKRTQELNKLAMLDPLTSLPNKAMLQHELEKAIACVGRIHNQVALLFLDLDEFKRINDTLGHHEGDELLIIVAERLGKCVRAMDTVFRQGGDEFLILLRGIDHEQEVRKVIHKIFSSLQQPVVLKSHKLIVTTSIGVAICQSSHMAAEELIQHADLAMYQAKAAGRSNYRVFTYDLLHQANTRLMIEQDIGAAIRESQLKLFLQPIIAIDTGKVCGFEGLVRWFHPQRGLIMPADFIPDIEHSQAIIEVGNYVLKEGIRILKRMQAVVGDELYIAINLSANHYLSADLSHHIASLLAEHKLAPGRLLLEVTEESVMAQVEHARLVMEELKLSGVRIAIDDFGTGYSSLSYLKQLPFDVLKIDRCFISGINVQEVDTHIVNTVISLAHNLGRKVVGEGIENEEQLQFLKAAGCEYAQGYLFARALSEEQVLSMLAQIKTSLIWPTAKEAINLGRLGS
ncbi:bifunctional diguanylate cyclase/phosphodiesterase [Shewanella sp. NIFS-20-20]|uniref:putative bifunctional diguanylate cyclase/phosphodiesterase n=1 Tax=Shewanella sp. NIFS-20-20 TaxID=2853806 RepID=UPI00210D0DBA|nr:bifunctional diguanylate cyclase/phosphodiesterase [Shewanella sp. NIFS-20-20]